MKKKIIIISLIVLAVISGNVFVYSHAYKMTFFTTSGKGTKKPEDLSKLEKIKTLFTGINVIKPGKEIAKNTFGKPYKTINFKGGYYD